MIASTNTPAAVLLPPSTRCSHFTAFHTTGLLHTGFILISSLHVTHSARAYLPTLSHAQREPAASPQQRELVFLPVQTVQLQALQACSAGKTSALTVYPAPCPLPGERTCRRTGFGPFVLPGIHTAQKRCSSVRLSCKRLQECVQNICSPSLPPLQPQGCCFPPDPSSQPQQHKVRSAGCSGFEQANAAPIGSDGRCGLSVCAASTSTGGCAHDGTWAVRGSVRPGR